MKDFKSIKCGNCGSTKFNQISNDMFECEYCGASIVNDNTIKDMFLNDLNSSGNVIKNLYFLKANFSEDEFLKRAYTQLTLNKFSPKDILNANFSKVRCRYIFFITMEVDFTGISVKNIVSSEEYDNNFKFSTKHSEVYSADKLMCVPITDDVYSDRAQVIFEDVHELASRKLSRKAKKEEIEKLDIQFPTNDKFTTVIEETIEEEKQKILSESEGEVNKVIHKIDYIKVFAVPEYVLEYEYEGEKYEICSYAHKSCITGQFPNKGDDIEESKVSKFFSRTCFGAGILILLFQIISFILRYYDLIYMNFIAFFFYTLLFLIYWIVDSKLAKSFDKKLLKEKKEMLLNHFEKLEINLTEDDLIYIDAFKGGE